MAADLWAHGREMPQNKRNIQDIHPPSLRCENRQIYVSILTVQSYASFDATEKFS